MRLLSSCVFALLFIGIGAGRSATAATIYASPSGSDTSQGTLDAPVATPQRALQLAGPGDTVLLRGGGYSITRSLQITQAGLTFASYPGEWAHITGATMDLTNLTSVLIVYASNVTVRDVELEGASYYGMKLDDYYGPQHDIRIAHVSIHHTGRDGIKGQNADNVTIEGCDVGFTGVRDSTNADGIDLMGSIVASVRHNHVHDIATTGIYVKAGTRQAVVESNLIERTGFAGILLGSESDAQFMRDGAIQEAIDSVARNNIVISASLAGLGSISGDNVRFENNTVIDAARTGQAAFRVASNGYGTPAHNVLLKNNVFVLDPASTRPMVQLYNYSDPIVSDSNVWFSETGRYAFWREFSTKKVSSSYWTFAEWRSAMNADGHSRTVDPLLDSADLYRPQQGSPVVDAGETLTEVPVDYSGVARPEGAGYDIGAHERAASTVEPPPPPPVPAAPTALTVTASSRASIALTWVDNASDEQGFWIERSTAGGAYTRIATAGPDTRSYVDATVKPNKTYAYRVAAFNAAGASAYTNIVTTTAR